MPTSSPKISTFTGNGIGGANLVEFLGVLQCLHILASCLHNREFKKLQFNSQQHNTRTHHYPHTIYPCVTTKTLHLRDWGACNLSVVCVAGAGAGLPFPSMVSFLSFSFINIPEPAL